MGGGKGGKGGGSNWGGQGPWNPMKMMMEMMMSKGKGKGPMKLWHFHGDKRVWIGGLPQKGARDETLNKQLKEHMSSSGLSCIFAEVGKNGMGGAAFKTEDEAKQAITAMNGTMFEGSIIQVDVLTKGNK
mmetsp:Transcript_11559/g.20474  ORF Transcript_11559/g.20474 Transcript_11559/m.20474 type:complete len:130 (+) Transcript_11559:57-446(+)|eukprot:CAMPEP_0197651318 /NCGR_PEP_ID=MMETSP1338-20131121/31911_1 /TAXON_ID=43686 ORGANISM="Pelagodinium beii, Strain RCC1491" /NCGR_SAMPLE_ID=MMETSP1338 /ASSEMBLY_ACC=CAM_ASM_000754 /LENGTH=129 /DNA_ID=CAMNT_0043225923 /DNA_START=56 /DNA_END=445 /DNA_ORIENTATION=+